MTFEEISERYTVMKAESIRYDIRGCHHTGFDAIDEDGELWGVFVNDDDEYFLMR